MGNKDKKWAIVYYNDEIGIRLSWCKQDRDNCVCEYENNGPKCYYSTAEALIIIRNHYKMVYEKYMKMNEAKFLEHMGIEDDV